MSITFIRTLSWFWLYRHENHMKARQKKSEHVTRLCGGLTRLYRLLHMQLTHVVYFHISSQMHLNSITLMAWLCQDLRHRTTMSSPCWVSLTRADRRTLCQTWACGDTCQQTWHQRPCTSREELLLPTPASPAARRCYPTCQPTRVHPWARMVSTSC